MGKLRYTQEEIISRFKAVHGDKFDYSKVEYKGIFHPIIIICPKHGIFEQAPHEHLKGNGCPMCAKNRKMTTESFILKASQVHGDKYDYSKVEYVNSTTPICIICPIHGEFWQAPDGHIQGHECRKCGRLKAAQNKKYTHDEFVAKASAVHKNKYDYSKGEYKGCYEPMTIICPEHGPFEQTPYTHIYGIGCPKCSKYYHKGPEGFLEAAVAVHGG